MLLLCERITLNKSSLFILWQIGVIILNSHKAVGKYITLPKMYGSLERHGDVRVFKSTENPVFVKYLDFEDFVTISNDEYPEKELSRIVEETKKIIQSRDKASRKQIKIDESYDLWYLKGKNQQLISSIEGTESNPVNTNNHSIVRFRSRLTYYSSIKEKNPPEDEVCTVRKLYVTPRSLSHYYIMNTPNLEQTIKISRCESEQNTCGLTYKNQVLGYKRVCTQDYKRIELIAHPANVEFNATNQELLSMRVRSGCKCSLIRS